ncbi:MAG: dTDP-4-dehydrorhamnose reductase [Chloroflexia bacterium]|nr:dTDP-4-dehydrorhamnose reductase [Chloroflexia bacterium]
MSVGDEQSRVDIRGQRIVVTGAAGQLGTYLRQELVDAGAMVIGFGHRAGPGIDVPVDIVDAQALEAAIDGAHADVIIHAAAMTDVDGCEKNPQLADSINHLGSRNVANAAFRFGAHLVSVSTDFVFSGAAPPYAEDAATDPISIYGASKRAGEQAILDVSETFAISRTAWVYGGNGKHFPRSILNLLASRHEIDVVEDERGNPTFAGDLAHALVQIVALRQAGLVHLTNEGTASRFELARQVATMAGLDPERIHPTTVQAFLQKYPLPARRPADSSLTNIRAAAIGVTLRPWQDALASYVPRLVKEMQSTPA